MLNNILLRHGRRSQQLQKRFFSEFLIPESVLLRIKELGICKASPVQKALLPLFHTHSSILLKDQTGNGKTLGLVLGALAKKNPKLDQQRDTGTLAEEYQGFLKRRLGSKIYTATLFIVPTVELAMQIYSWTVKLAPKELESQIQLAVPSTVDFGGGGTVEDQKEKMLKNIPTIVIGTPNRLWDLYTVKAIDFSRLQTVIVDEVDRIVEPLSRYATGKQKKNRKVHKVVGEKLLDTIFAERGDSTNKRMGIGAQVDVARRKPLQMIASSATLNNPLKFYLSKQKRWMKNAVILDLNGKSYLPSTIKHKAYYMNENQLLVPITQADLDKEVESPAPSIGGGRGAPVLDYDSLSEAIYSISHTNNFKNALVFVQTNDSLIPLRDCLKSLGLNVKFLNKAHDDLETSMAGKCDIILARDIESRGLDVPGLDHVLLIGDYPHESYIHTAGRTGRFGAKGTAISLLLDSVQRQRYLKTCKSLNIHIE